jgi:hypothetical protein
MKMPSGNPAHEVILKLYPGACQGFDLEGVDEFRHQRYRWLYNPGTATDAIIQVREFLSKHME